MDIKYKHWTAIDNNWFKDNRFFQESELSDRWLMLYLITNIIREPSKKFKNYSIITDLLRRGFLTVNTSLMSISDNTGLHRQTVYNSRDRLIKKGLIIYRETDKHLTNNIFIVGIKSNQYGEFLFLEADNIKFGGYLNKNTVKYMNNNYMELDFFTRTNEDNKTFIEALYPVFIRENGLWKAE